MKKAQKAVLKKKSKYVLIASHTLLGAALLLIAINLIQYTAGKYDIEKLNYNAEIQVTNDKDYGGGHSEAPVPYEMKIPTSGVHSPHDLKYGFYNEKPPYEKLVHNLEHGDIVIYYPPNTDAETLEKLNVLAHYRKAGSGILAVPNGDVPANDKIVATAWTKTMELPAYDEAKVGTFIYKFINRGPEVIPPEIRQGGGTM
ncbi:hypothetical protein PAECIP111802_03102 [Paenibacillus allorhizosphaerae]|uniref:DUF3105 domain-containing protein n=1 Tax=Paenibacillus allorhizosphaerae TaxID=2849866 RepID=A0ABM8VIT4_9BACL|nr:hypothetical protein PAECIP111802_03102 [Paenibacillus allorhizosphaerae]